MAVAPGAAVTQHAACILVIKFGIKHPAIVLVLIIFGSFVRTICIEAKPVLCTGHIAIKTTKRIIGLVFAQYVGCYMPFGSGPLRDDVNYTGEGIAAIHQRSRSL